MRAKRWAGLILTALPVPFLLFDTVINASTIRRVADCRRSDRRSSRRCDSC